MAHQHHRCECKHASVKFCASCKVVHCLACKQEWSFTPCTKPHQSLYNPWSLQYGGGAIGVGSATYPSSGLLATNVNSTVTVTDTECSH